MSKSEDMGSADVSSNSDWTDNTLRPADYEEKLYKEWYRWKTDPAKILHNVNGAALIFSDGEERFYLDGFNQTKEEWERCLKQSLTSEVLSQEKSV